MAAKLKRTYPWLLYVHCAAHRLNLVVYFRTVKAAFNVINIYKSLHAIFNVASHREVFEATQRDFYPKEHITASSSLTEVRWACKFEGVNTIDDFKLFCKASKRSAPRIPAKLTQFAAGLYHKILSGKCVICLCFVHKVLSLLDGLSKLLQEININWITVGSEMVALRKLLVEIEIDEIIEIPTKLSIYTVYINCRHNDSL